MGYNTIQKGDYPLPNPKDVDFYDVRREGSGYVADLFQGNNVLYTLADGLNEFPTELHAHGACKRLGYKPYS